MYEVDISLEFFLHNSTLVCTGLPAITHGVAHDDTNVYLSAWPGALNYSHLLMVLSASLNLTHFHHLNVSIAQKRNENFFTRLINRPISLISYPPIHIKYTFVYGTYIDVLWRHTLVVHTLSHSTAHPLPPIPPSPPHTTVGNSFKIRFAFVRGPEATLLKNIETGMGCRVKTISIALFYSRRAWWQYYCRAY